MSPYGCGCDPLFEECLPEKLSQLAGVAQCRGEAWARSIANVCPIDKAWPATARMREIAIRKVRDLADDKRLTELLADEVARGAERWWNRALEQAG